MSCKRAKAVSITENALVLKSQALLVHDLEYFFFLIGMDASKKGNKIFPVTVHYFPKTEGIKMA